MTIPTIPTGPRQELAAAQLRNARARIVQLEDQLRAAAIEAGQQRSLAIMRRILVDERNDRIADLQARIAVQDGILDGREHLIYALQCRERHRQTVRAGRSPLGRLAGLVIRARRTLARRPAIPRLAIFATVLMLAILGLQYLPGW